MSQVTSAEVPSGSGLSVRQAINMVLAALMSQNSGPSAPANPIAGQAWMDTATGRLKARNASNTAFLDLVDMLATIRHDAVQSLTTAQIAQVLANIGITMTKSTQGQIKIGDLIIKWGSTTVPAGGFGAITLPIAFPNNFRAVVAGVREDAGASFAYTVSARPQGLSQIYVVGHTIQASSVTLAGVGISYIAIGD